MHNVSALYNVFYIRCAGVFFSTCYSRRHMRLSDTGVLVSGMARCSDSDRSPELRRRSRPSLGCPRDPGQRSQRADLRSCPHCLCRCLDRRSGLCTKRLGSQVQHLAGSVAASREDLEARCLVDGVDVDVGEDGDEGVVADDWR